MNKGFTLTEAGDYEKAFEIYQPFISDTSLEGPDRFVLFNYLGRLYSFVDKEQSFRYFNMAEEYMDDPFLYTDQSPDIMHGCRTLLQTDTCNANT
jgi:hypothetical protein